MAGDPSWAPPGVDTRRANVARVYDYWLGGSHNFLADQDLGRAVPLPASPWAPDGCTVRWVLLHLIEETARHAGHADLLREAIDGSVGE